MKTTYDVFISHASKDKEKYVDKLVEVIKAKRIAVFYDSDCIAWGDGISEKIEEGLKNCKLAVVVISKNYFGRKWAEHELLTLLKRQNQEGKRIIMPILHGITKKQLIEHYPELADISSKYSKSYSVENMAQCLADKLKTNGTKLS